MSKLEIPGEGGRIADPSPLYETAVVEMRCSVMGLVQECPVRVVYALILRQCVGVFSRSILQST